MSKKIKLPYILAFLIFTAIVILCIKQVVKDEFGIKNSVNIDSSTEEKTEEPNTETVSPTNTDKIKVYITGAVVRPDVYEIPKENRIIDLVDAAGGFVENADKSKINLAGFLYDGDMVTIPFKEEYSDDSSVTSFSYESKTVTVYNQPKSKKININTADIAELASLNGIGESKANAIIEYRKVYVFEKIEDIKKVRGISESIYKNIKDDITV